MLRDFQNRFFGGGGGEISYATKIWFYMFDFHKRPSIAGLYHQLLNTLYIGDSMRFSNK